MKFTILCKHKGDQHAVSNGTAWKETYDKHEITDFEGAEIWAAQTVENFNAGLRPGEKARELVSVMIDDRKPDVAARHSWDKENLVTLNNKLGMYDQLVCRHCGARAKRFGMDSIVMDRPYRKRIHCPGPSEFSRLANAIMYPK